MDLFVTEVFAAHVEGALPKCHTMRGIVRKSCDGFVEFGPPGRMPGETKDMVASSGFRGSGGSGGRQGCEQQVGGKVVGVAAGPVQPGRSVGGGQATAIST